MPSCMAAGQPSNGYTNPQWGDPLLQGEESRRDAEGAEFGVETAPTRRVGYTKGFLGLAAFQRFSAAFPRPLGRRGASGAVQNGMSSSVPPDEPPPPKSSKGASGGMS